MTHKPIKQDIIDYWITECPACNSKIRFHEMGEHYGIEVNCETRQTVHIPNMLHLTKSCTNPFCKWSKL